MTAVVSLLLKKQRVEEQLAILQQYSEQTTPQGVKEDSLKLFIDEIIEIVYDNCDIREALMSFYREKVSIFIE